MKRDISARWSEARVSGYERAVWCWDIVRTLQRRTGEHETSGAPIQTLWNASSSLVVPMAVRRAATKTLLLCFLAGNGTCCFSFHMSFTHSHWGADPNPQPRRARGFHSDSVLLLVSGNAVHVALVPGSYFVTVGSKWGSEIFQGASMQNSSQQDLWQVVCEDPRAAPNQAVSLRQANKTLARQHKYRNTSVSM